MPTRAAASAHWVLRCSVGQTTVTASTEPSSSSSAAIRRANVVLPAPGVATARKSSLRRRRYSTRPRRCQARSDPKASRAGGGGLTRRCSLPVRPGHENAPAPQGREGGSSISAPGNGPESGTRVDTREAGQDQPAPPGSSHQDHTARPGPVRGPCAAAGARLSGAATRRSPCTAGTPARPAWAPG
jgi:hypothetical protein